MMKFYKENQINPAASCLPMLAQFPVFIALYFVLRHFATHLRRPEESTSPGSATTSSRDITDHANAHWSGYVLLVDLRGSQIASTYFMSATMDKTQRRS